MLKRTSGAVSRILPPFFRATAEPRVYTGTVMGLTYRLHHHPHRPPQSAWVMVPCGWRTPGDVPRLLRKPGELVAQRQPVASGGTPCGAWVELRRKLGAGDLRD